MLQAIRQKRPRLDNQPVAVEAPLQSVRPPLFPPPSTAPAVLFPLASTASPPSPAHLLTSSSPPPVHPLPSPPQTPTVPLFPPAPTGSTRSSGNDSAAPASSCTVYRMTAAGRLVSVPEALLQKHHLDLAQKRVGSQLVQLFEAQQVLQNVRVAVGDLVGRHARAFASSSLSDGDRQALLASNCSIAPTVQRAADGLAALLTQQRLTPADLQLVHSLRDQVALLHCHLSVLAAQARGGTAATGTVRLHLFASPLPLVATKGRSVEQPIELHLISAPGVRLELLGPVSVEVTGAGACSVTLVDPLRSPLPFVLSSDAYNNLDHAAPAAPAAKKSRRHATDAKPSAPLFFPAAATVASTTTSLSPSLFPPSSSSPSLFPPSSSSPSLFPPSSSSPSLFPPSNSSPSLQHSSPSGQASSPFNTPPSISSSAFDNANLSSPSASSPAGTPTSGAAASSLDSGGERASLQSLRASYSMTVATGSRKLPVQLRFGLDVREVDSGAPTTLYTAAAGCEMISITNEAQWAEAAGLLLRRDVFKSIGAEVSWPQLANVLNHHFTAATRQDPDFPARWLDDAEYAFFHRAFFGGTAVVSNAQYTQFWEWFGPALHRLRYQRGASQMWQEGSLVGFLPRQAAEHILLSPTLPSRTFLLRFSQHHPGRFVVSYVRRQHGKLVVGHYLIGPDEICGASNQLPDYLYNHGNVKYCLLKIPAHESHIVRAAPPSSLESMGYRYVPKQEVLGRLISPKKAGAESAASDRYDSFIFPDES